MLVKYTICYLGSIMIIRAYCVGNAHKMLLWKYYDIGSILCRQRTQYATLVVL